MSADDEIYQGIGKVLAATSPADAEVVLVQAELSSEGDHCKLFLDYIDPSGAKQRFLPSSAKVDGDLLDLLFGLEVFLREKRGQIYFWLRLNK